MDIFSAAFDERLNDLRRRENPGVAPLWADALPPEEALMAVRGVDAAWARLVEARALTRLGRGDEALALLDALGQDQPPGIARYRDGLRDEALASLASRLSDAVSQPSSPAAEASSPEDQRAAALKLWLDRVRQWRGKAP